MFEADYNMIYIGGTTILKIGEPYPVKFVDVIGDYLMVFMDKGTPVEYCYWERKKFFMTIPEYRKLKIEKLRNVRTSIK